jgi:hypothetical protein
MAVALMPATVNDGQGHVKKNSYAAYGISELRPIHKVKSWRRFTSEAILLTAPKSRSPSTALKDASHGVASLALGGRCMNQNAGDVVLAAALFGDVDKVGAGGFEGRGGEDGCNFFLENIAGETVGGQ